MEKLKSTFRMLVDDVGQNVLADMLEIPNRKVGQLVQHGNVDMVSFHKISQKLGVTIYNTFDGIDYECAKKYLYGHKGVVKNKYRQNAFSTRNLSWTILNSLRNSNECQYALRYLQADENAFCDSGETEISSQFNYDLFKFLKQHMRYSAHDLEDIGANVCRNLQDSAFGQAFRGLSFVETYEMLTQEVFKHLEQTHKWSITKLSNSYAIIRKYPILKFSDDYGDESCNYVAGIASAVTLFSQGIRVKTKEIKCVHNGDPYCEFFVDFRQLLQ